MVDGSLEAKSVGDTIIRFECGATAAEQAVRVRRRFRGIVLEEYADLGVPTASITVRDEPDTRTVVTDESGRFDLSVKAAEPTVEVVAPEFIRLSRSLAAGDLQLRLEPALVVSSWSGTFERVLNSARTRGRPPGGRYEFETHHRGWITLTASADCDTQGTYDDFGIIVEGADSPPEKWVLSVAPSYGPDSMRKLVDRGRYVLTIPEYNFYAESGCPWQVGLSRPY